MKPDLSNKKEIFQFELWNECKEYRCKFCSLVYNSRDGHDGDEKNPNIFCPPERKLKILSKGLTQLDSIDWNKFDQLSFQGGEVMNDADPLWLPVYNQLLNKVISLMKEGKVKRLFLITSLKYVFNDSLLEYTINAFKKQDMTAYLLIGTSYDLKYRFTEELEKRWWDNVYTARSYGVQVHCTTILTQFFIDAYMNKNPKIVRILEEFSGDNLDLIGAIGDRYCDMFPPDFLPKRESFFKVAIDLMQNQSKLWWRFVDQSERRAIVIYKLLSGKEEWRDIKNNTCPHPEILGPCGHYKNCRSYADCDECFACDVKQLSDMEQGILE